MGDGLHTGSDGNAFEKTLRKARDLLGLVSTLLRFHSHLEKRLDRVSEVARQEVVQRSEKERSAHEQHK